MLVSSLLLIQFIVIFFEPFDKLHTSLDGAVIMLTDYRISFIPTRNVRRTVFLRERKLFGEREEVTITALVINLFWQKFKQTIEAPCRNNLISFSTAISFMQGTVIVH